MTTVTGYLTAVRNPHFSGLAAVEIRTRKHRTARHPGKIYTTYAEAGFGVRQLVDAFGDGRGFSKASGEIRARFTIDELGLLAGVEIL